VCRRHRAGARYRFPACRASDARRYGRGDIACDARRVISELSFRSVLVEAISCGQVIGTASGFGVVYGGKPYLITNYHVASGRHPETGQPLHSSGGIPDTLRVQLPDLSRTGFVDWVPLELPVLQIGESGEEHALWLEHPLEGRAVDVVAIQLPIKVEALVAPYDPFDESPQLIVGPSSELSIIGFPFGRTGGGHLGIWIKGSVASEPEVALDGLTRFLVDARTRDGQSGSPVIAYSDGTNVAAFAGGGMTIGSARPTVSLVGVYSGRINRNSDLGYVWRTEVVRDILRAQQPGRAGL